MLVWRLYHVSTESDKILCEYISLKSTSERNEIEQVSIEKQNLSKYTNAFVWIELAQLSKLFAIFRLNLLTWIISNECCLMYTGTS